MRYEYSESVTSVFTTVSCLHILKSGLMTVWIVVCGSVEHGGRSHLMTN